MADGNFAANGVFSVPLPYDPHRAVPPTLFARGAWGSGSIAVTISPDGNSPVALAAPIAISADGYKVLPLIGGTFTLTLTGATNPNIDWWIL